MSTAESEFEMAKSKLETPTEESPETLTERVERELQDLRLNGVIPKKLPTITVSTLNALLPQSRMDFFRAGGKVVDDPPPPKEKLPEGAITRSAFENMTREQKLTFARSGAKLYDDPDPADIRAAATAEERERAEMMRRLGMTSGN